MKRGIILVLDSFGIGASEDAIEFGDAGANTLGHIAEQCALGNADIQRSGPLKLPNLTSLGLMHAARLSSGCFPEGCASETKPVAATGMLKNSAVAKIPQAVTGR